jgi:uncharacterized protein (TIGR02246 family)
LTIESVVERYVAAIRARDIDGLLALYAEDATAILPNGKEFRGVAAIGEMQRSVFAGAAPTPTIVHKVFGENSAAIEIEARLADGSVRRTANFYQLSPAGRIVRLSVYMRS